MIPIRCKYSRVVPIHEVRPNPLNPNQHPDPQVVLLAKAIAFQGWRSPLVVSNRSGMIVKGHARLSAARILDLPEVPIDEQDYETEEQEIADMIADNRLAELAEIHPAKLKDLIEHLDTGGIDLDLTGYDQNELENLMSQIHPGDDLLDPDPTNSFKCPECGHEWTT